MRRERFEKEDWLVAGGMETRTWRSKVMVIGDTEKDKSAAEVMSGSKNNSLAGLCPGKVDYPIQNSDINLI